MRTGRFASVWPKRLRSVVVMVTLSTPFAIGNGPDAFTVVSTVDAAASGGAALTFTNAGADDRPVESVATTRNVYVPSTSATKCAGCVASGVGFCNSVALPCGSEKTLQVKATRSAGLQLVSASLAVASSLTSC